MSRSGYVDDCWDDCWAMIRYRGAVKSAIRGKRGQAFFRELLTSLDGLLAKRLIADDLVDEHGEVCALGSVAIARGLDADSMDSTNHRAMAKTFDVARCLIKEIEWENDDHCCGMTPEQRWQSVRDWVSRKIVT